MLTVRARFGVNVSMISKFLAFLRGSSPPRGGEMSRRTSRGKWPTLWAAAITSSGAAAEVKLNCGERRRGDLGVVITILILLSSRPECERGAKSVKVAFWWAVIAIVSAIAPVVVASCDTETWSITRSISAWWPVNRHVRRFHYDISRSFAVVTAAPNSVIGKWG